jgi:hypothetical protein
MVVEADDFRLGGHHPGVIPHKWHGWLVWGVVKVGRRRVAPSSDWFTVSPYDETMKVGGALVHDATTPFQACYRIVSMWAEAGYTVVDPFMGLGTIGQAARMLGHVYIGSETDIRWHNRAIATMNAGIQSEMFA